MIIEPGEEPHAIADFFFYVLLFAFIVAVSFGLLAVLHIVGMM